MVETKSDFLYLLEKFLVRDVIQIPKKEYIIYTEEENAFVFENRDDIVIDGMDSTISFGGKVRPFVFRNCQNISIKNMTIDYWELPYTHGEVVSSDGCNFVIKLYDKSADEVPEIKAYLEYDRHTLEPLKNGNDIYWDCKSVEKIDKQTIQITFNNKYSIPPVGTLIVLRHEIYDYDGFTFYDCKNVLVENVIIRCAAGMGICAYGCDDLKFLHLEIAPDKKSRRLMSTTGDGIHLMNCSGQVVVENCYFAYLGDDSFNSHGMFLQVLEFDNSIIKAVHPKGYNLLPRIGDVVEFTRAGVLLPYGEGVVKAARHFEEIVVLEIEHMSGEILQIGDYIANATRNIQLLYQNNIVENKRCRGILVQTRNAIIRNNVFKNVSGGGILVFSEDISFYESIGTRNIVIENNKLIHNNHAIGKCQGDISVVSYTTDYKLGGIGVHKNIIIRNNKIENTAFRGIYVACAMNVIIESNSIRFDESVTGDVAVIKIEHCSNVLLEQNALQNKERNNQFVEIGEHCKNIAGGNV